VLHLHGFHHGNLLTGRDLVTFRHVDGDDGALDRRADAGGAVRPAVGLHLLRRPLCLLGLRARVVIEQRQGIAGVHTGAGETIGLRDARP